MPTQKFCNVRNCKEFTFTALDDLWESNWMAYQTPAGKGKINYYCPNHHVECSEDMQSELTRK